MPNYSVLEFQKLSRELRKWVEELRYHEEISETLKQRVEDSLEKVLNYLDRLLEEEENHGWLPQDRKNPTHRRS